MLDPEEPDFSKCGWFYHYQRESWIWWHGSAPHAAFPFENQQQDLDEPEDENLG